MFSYTTAETVSRSALSSSVPGIAEQAPESVHALLVTTYVSTMGTNLGGQAMTTSICEVYLRDGVIKSLGPENDYAQSQCLDPRQYACSVAQLRSETSASALCQATDRSIYLPTNIRLATRTDGGVVATTTSGAVVGLDALMPVMFGLPGAAVFLGMFK